MRGVASNCPRCGASNRVPPYVVASDASGYSHRCTRCAAVSPLAAWAAAVTASRPGSFSEVPKPS